MSKFIFAIFLQKCISKNFWNNWFNKYLHFAAKPVIIDKVQKCITCGGAIANNPKRKGPKLIRCENCIAQDSVDQQRNNQSEYILVLATCLNFPSGYNVCAPRSHSCANGTL